MSARVARLALASALLVAAPALGPLPGSGPAAGAATTAKYVGIVISGDKSACVPWRSGITGDDILNKVASVHYRPADGLIDQIDGRPSPAHADATHYWSYWHNSGKGWVYSSSGASGYTPAAGTVEGWNFINGSSSRVPPSSSGSYASLCGGLEVRPSTPTRRPSSHPVAHPSQARTTAPGGRSPVGGARVSGSSSASPGASSRPTSARSSGSACASTRCPRTTATGTTSPPASGASTGSDGAVIVEQSSSPLAHRAGNGRSGGSVWPVVLGVALFLVIGGAAATSVVLRRNAGHG